MIRSELIKRVAKDNPNLALRDVERQVSAMFDAISDHLVAGGRIELRGFGAFSTRSRDARIGRNPSTGEKVDVAAKRVIYFKLGKEIRKRLNVE